MIRALLIAVALFALAVAVRAQTTPQPPSASAQFAAQLATLLVGTLEERDAARAQLAACQAAVKAPEAPKP